MVIPAELNQSLSAVLLCVCEPVGESVCAPMRCCQSALAVVWTWAKGSQVGLDCGQMVNKVNPARGGLSEAGAKVQLLVMNGARFLHTQAPQA